VSKHASTPTTLDPDTHNTYAETSEASNEGDDLEECGGADVYSTSHDGKLRYCMQRREN
jgi:hypothetical protein